MNDGEELVMERPQRCPTHPGKLLRDTVLPALRLDVTTAAAELRISRQTLHRLLAQNMGVSPEMALRLGKFCGNGPGIWLRMQAAFDLWKAAEKIGSELDHIPSHAA